MAGKKIKKGKGGRVASLSSRLLDCALVLFCRYPVRNLTSWPAVADS